MGKNEHVNLKIIENTLSYATSRAIGVLTAKYSQTTGMAFEVYQTIYNTCVTPFIDYASEVWGYKTYPKLETVQTKAIKGYLDVGKACTTPMFEGDSGCYPTHIRRKYKILAFWNKLVDIDNSRHIKKRIPP